MIQIIVGWILTLCGLMIMFIGLRMFEMNWLMCVIEIVVGMLFVRSGVRFRRLGKKILEDEKGDKK